MATAEAAALEVSGLGVRFPGQDHPVLDGVDLRIERGEFITVVGASGSGKTTLLRAIHGLLPASAGEVQAAGKPVKGPSRTRGFVFQADSLLPWRTVIDNVAYPLELRGVGRSERRAAAHELLELTGLAAAAEKFPRQISGGMRQRANLARALVADPEILLMDEPFAALDAQTREILQAELLSIWGQRQKTVVFVTHQLDDAALMRAVLGENGAASTLRPGCVHASMSTISPDGSRRLADAHAAAGQLYVAAPVMGRPEAAQRGELTILAAGKPEAIEKSRPIFNVLGKQTRVLGDEPTKANVAKLGVNFVLASILEVLGEAYALVESHDIDDETFLSIVNDSLLKSPVIGAYGKRIAEDAFEPAGFRLALGAKDVRLAVETGERASVPMPVASILRDRFVAAIAEGFADDDWAVVGRASTVRYDRIAH